jgi:hypothetical protein
MDCAREIDHILSRAFNLAGAVKILAWLRMSEVGRRRGGRARTGGTQACRSERSRAATARTPLSPSSACLRRRRTDDTNGSALIDERGGRKARGREKKGVVAAPGWLTCAAEARVQAARPVDWGGEGRRRLKRGEGEERRVLLLRLCLSRLRRFG